ncbi:MULTISPECIES: response regulator transcription factor [Polyangium]|uniref:DNA-binding response regulator n=1 Tax=Polyangium jinanense TaxID=2829994 RepID=A0A9X4AXZ5_9BACT|nr:MULTISPECIES: DNA-binding response regulator [Polyangium]MDC3958840.1 DNA-binding response regulator [Polyangium jinanense]MDC3989183.1 DNA-binding response regulator [Polyangium jinanense]MDI3290103.1 DNA-binding response regulator [Polyangium sp. 15x6]
MPRKIETALLIDDDDAFRTTLQGAMRRRGVQARTAATVEEGVVALEDAPVDLVVVDYRMPRVDGLSALPRLRRLCPEAAIVMLTGFGDIPLAVAAVREGADTLLTKPIDADRLLREATVLFERPRAPFSGAPPSSRTTYKLDELERDAINAALKDSGGVIAVAAKLLGIDRRTLQRKLKKSS